MFVDENPLSCPFVHAVPAFPTTTFPDGIHSLHYNHTEDDDYSNLILLQLMMMAKKKDITVLHILIIKPSMVFTRLKTFMAILLKLPMKKTVVYRDYYIITCAKMNSLD